MRSSFGKLLQFITLLVFVVPLLISSIPTVSADTDASPWFAGDPDIETSGIITPEELIEIRKDKVGYSAGLDCIDKRIAKRNLLSINLEYENSCWQNTAIGLFSESSNYLLTPGTEIAGEIKRFSETDNRFQPLLRATPNENIFVELRNYKDSMRTRLWHKDDIVLERREVQLGPETGRIKLGLPSSPSFIPSPATHGLYIPPDGSVTWSSDKRYMITTNDSGSMFIFDLEEFKTTTTRVINYTSANKRSVAALSPSGRYAAFAVEVRGVFMDLVVVDLLSCTSDDSTWATTLNNCHKRSFRNNLLAANPQLDFVTIPRFYGDNTLGVYGGRDSDIRQYTLQAFGTEKPENNYMALGDSFSSGEGAGDYIEGTDEPFGNICHTSENSYPYVMNAQLDLVGFASVACSGAKIKNYHTEAQHGDDSKPITSPGSHPQNEAISDYETDVATLTISGNDIGFGDRLAYCLAGSSACYSSQSSRRQIADQIAGQHKRLVDMFNDIQSQGVKRLYVLGYPSFVTDADDVQCGLNVQLNSYQRRMANELLEYFNDVIESAALEAGVFYVDIENAFTGKRLCEATSAALAFNGITIGNDRGIPGIGGISAGTYHPNTLGHDTLAKHIMSATDNLTAEMPNPVANPIPNAEDYDFINNSIEDGTNRGKLINIGDRTLIARGRTFIISTVNEALPLNPLSPFEVWLYSEPTYLGQVTANGAGDINAQLIIPETVEPGLHELHIIGHDYSGNKVDLYRFVYVAVSEDDYDGDGIKNENEKCGIIESSGIDQDKDGVDDKCDPFISEIITDNNVDMDQKDDYQGTEINSLGEPSSVYTSALLPQLFSGLQVYSTHSPAVMTSNTDSNDVPADSSEAVNLIHKNNMWMLLTIPLVIIIGYSVLIYVQRKR